MSKEREKIDWHGIDWSRQGQNGETKEYGEPEKEGETYQRLVTLLVSLVTPLDIRK